MSYCKSSRGLALGKSVVEKSELVRCGNEEIDPNYLNYKGDPVVAPPLLTTSYLLFLTNEFLVVIKVLKKIRGSCRRILLKGKEK